MPSYTGEPARVTELMGKAAPFLLLLAANDADLVAKFAACFCEGMDVET